MYESRQASPNSKSARIDGPDSEFAGANGLFSNTDRGEPLSPRLEKTALMQTDPSDPESYPSHGTGGSRIL